MTEIDEAVDKFEREIRTLSDALEARFKYEDTQLAQLRERKKKRMMLVKISLSVLLIMSWLFIGFFGFRGIHNRLRVMKKYDGITHTEGGHEVRGLWDDGNYIYGWIKHYYRYPGDKPLKVGDCCGECGQSWHEWHPTTWGMDGSFPTEDARLRL